MTAVLEESTNTLIEPDFKPQRSQSQNLKEKKGKKKKTTVVEPPKQPMVVEDSKKIFKLDPDAKNGKRELLVITIALKNK